MKRHTVWPAIIVVLANLIVIGGLVFGGFIGAMLASPAALVGLPVLGFGLWKAREPFLLLGFPLLGLSLGLAVWVLLQCGPEVCE